VNIERGLTITANNKALLKKILLKFAETYQDISSELASLKTDNKLEDMERLAHSLKGASASIGAIDVQKLAYELELDLKSGKPVAAIDNQIRSLAENCEEVIEEINRLLLGSNDKKNLLHSAGQENRKAGSSNTRETSLKQLEKLKQMIESNDTSAENEVLQLLSSDDKSLDPLLLKTLLKDIQAYDFEAAEQTVRRIVANHVKATS
jgi:HPt (histidine-containing phosphotransfer) domain-containing protein